MACQREAAQQDREPARIAILVVEDEVLVRLFLADELRNAGFDVIESVSADEALAVLRSGTKISVLMTDVRMPGTMDGVALAKAVREEFPGIKILIASGHLPAVDAVHDGFFTKPYDVSKVVRTIAGLVEDGTPS
jgi:DNA-binding NtrC family response regulator